MNRILTQLLVAVGIVVGWSHLCSAQVQCSGVISGTITSDVICNGDCILDGATVTGNVFCSTGTLVAKGISTVNGDIQLSGTVTRAELVAVTVLGAVQAQSAGSLVELVIGATATLGSVTIDNTPGDAIVSGTLAGLSLVNSGDLFANGLSTIGTVSVLGGSGIVEFCGSSVGGLLLQQRQGDVEINANSPNCAATTLDQGISSSKGTGTVTVIGAILPSGDFTVTEHTGDVTLQTVPAVSDLQLNLNVGFLTICDVVADSDTMITKQVGNVVIENLDTLGDFSVSDVTGTVTVKDSDFNLEGISVVLVSGAVTVQNNIDLSLTVEQIGGLVEIVNNLVTSGSVNKNTGGVTFINNSFETLSCTDNNPAPTGSGNSITLPDGQCATGL